MSQAHGRVEHRNGGGKQRRKDLGLGQCRGDKLHIFLSHAHIHSAGRPTLIFHQGRAYLQHARASCAIAEQSDPSRRCNAPPLAHQQSFSCRYIVDGHQQITHQFHFYAVAEGAQVKAVFSKAVKDRGQLPNGSSGATGIDGEVFKHSLCASARTGAIEHHD